MFLSTKAKVITDESGGWVELPALLTPAGVLLSLLDYFLARQHVRSLSWMRKVIRSVELFLEYLQANPQQRDGPLLFSNFAERLYSGTFDLTTGLDGTGLCWSPRSSEDARNTITDLTLLFDWMGENNPFASALNPKVKATGYDLQWLRIARQYRRDNSLLGHLWSCTDSNPQTRKVQPKTVPSVHGSEPPAFPDDRFDELIEKGFRVGSRIDYRGILITLLLHAAGFRESEPFHLFIEDVLPDPRKPTSALVRIHHPSEGFAPNGWRDAFGRPRQGNRASYLAEKFGLRPRDDMLDIRHAGWKGGRYDGKYYKQAYWFEPRYGELFLAVWQKYLHQVARIERTHPFALINLTRDPLGGMYTIGQYVKAHGAACRRIGLKVAKDLGTTPHGHRHAYGRRLKNAGVEKTMIRRFMHHSSLESQVVYTQPSSTEIQSVLELAANKLALTIGAPPVFPMEALLLKVEDE
ncbi:phage integrase family protein [Paraburkholderia sp. BL27I4N3]|uniref:gamma-mobile-trio recombinase GmtY n=1 Tax=Paraburkholderia sp. BL27I4N3 TaxID=1938805 RepID=UPI000E246C7B|nr:gamma-mobile-trio recombinase GmtY [Paraburkholderia sp. BL27I4N3]REE23157.1 phage integrase family protein [Paraburkholderia sp. BL27I4N3]